MKYFLLCVMLLCVTGCTVKVYKPRPCPNKSCPCKPHCKCERCRC